MFLFAGLLAALAVHTRLDRSRFLVAILELEEYLPDVDTRAHLASLLGTVVPMQEALLELVFGVSTSRFFHFAMVAELLLEMRHVGRYSVEDVDFGRVWRHGFYADGRQGIRQTFPFGALGRNPLRSFANATNRLERLDFAEVERAIPPFYLDATTPQ